MDISIIKNSILFQGMSEDEIKSSLIFFSSREDTFKKGTFILHEGDCTDEMGFVISGRVTIERDDMAGNRTLLSGIEPGQFFAETFALFPQAPLFVNAVATTDCTVLFFRLGGLNKLRSSSGEPWMLKFVTNLLAISSRKNLKLSARNFFTAPKTIRERVMVFLKSVSVQKNSYEFEIPYNREQLADFLNLDRTALSKELGKMEREGLIEYDKSHFRLLFLTKQAN